MTATAIYTTLNWPTESSQALAKTQNVTEDNKIILNGSFVRPFVGASFINYGFRRNITISSTDDISATTSVIRGMINGIEVTENLGNPNADTVDSVNVFDSIIDITITGGDATNISVGTGTIGFFNPLDVNIRANTLSCSTIQFILYSGTVDYTIYQTADKSIGNNGITFDALIANGTYQVVEDSGGNDLEDLTTSSIFNNSPPILNTSYLVKINASNAAARFKLIYMQL